MNRIAVCHHELFAMRPVDILHHLRQEFNAEFRIAAKPQLLAEAHDSSRTRKGFLRQLTRRHTGQHAKVCQQIIGNHGLGFRKTILIL